MTEHSLDPERRAFRGRDSPPARMGRELDPGRTESLRHGRAAYGEHRRGTHPETDLPGLPTVRLILVLALLAALIAGAALAGRLLLQRDLVVVVPTPSSVPAPSPGSSSARAPERPCSGGPVLRRFRERTTPMHLGARRLDVFRGLPLQGRLPGRQRRLPSSGSGAVPVAVYGDACRWQEKRRTRSEPARWQLPWRTRRAS